MMVNPGNDPVAPNDTGSPSENEMPACASCGHQSAEQSRFCSECGARIPLLKNREIFDGRYEVIRLISQGPATEQYEVRHLELGEPRSLKILRPELFLEESHRLRFRREAKLASRVRHANVTELYDFVSMKDGGYYTVSEYLEGRTLREWYDSRETTDALAVVDIGIQVLNGLAAIHAAGIVHRDISPETILITNAAGATREGSDFRATIADLGIAKGLDPGAEDDAATEAGRFMGNVRYSSPEQAGMSDEQLDGRSDLYSLGVTLYEMLAGELPFRALTPQGYLERHVSGAPRPLTEAAPNAGYPPSLDAVISKAIEKDREERYQTVSEFRDALLEARRDLADKDHRPLPVAKRTEAPQPSPAAAFPVVASEASRSADAAASSRVPEGSNTVVEVKSAASPAQPAPEQAPSVAEATIPPATTHPVDVAALKPPAAEAPAGRDGFETAPLQSSTATRDVSASNTYDPLARKGVNWSTWIPLLLLGALVLWGIWIMARPAPEPEMGELEITATSADTDTATPIETGANETAPLAPLPPNIIDPVAGEGSILQELPPDTATQQGVVPNDLTAQPAASQTSDAEVQDSPFPNPQVSEREAINIIITGVNRTSYYGVEARCVGVGSSRYVNGGYTIELITRSCPGGSRPPGTLLGRWRVDGRTGDAYVQNSRGKYVSP